MSLTVATSLLRVQPGQTVEALLNFTWTGANSITVTQITFSGAAAEWLSLAETLSKTVSKQVGSETGMGAVTIRLMVPRDAQPGDYTVPVRIHAEAVGNQIETGGYLTFRVVEPTRPSTAYPDYMTILFAAIIITAYLKRR